MAGALRHLLNRNGRFFARLTIPKSLRPHLQNRTELRIPLGPDRREAVRLLAGAVAQMQEKLAAARRDAGEEMAPSVPTPKRRVSKPRAIYQLYQDLLFSDDFLRDREPDYAELVRKAHHTNRLEGIEPDPDIDHIFEAFVRGEIEATDLVPYIKAAQASR
ncbi:antitoxin VbhA family protein [Segnochrobactrum spirostomi]|uniref:Uncharacterized protein n=1 Tax=Segnochrobactrum spirostomi TaxID=2608987 RepID=A0A6A7Y1N5_9HYPH|nr:DUF6538 domain-containing protein [Segnochrobactrum spirostomi]MQT12031.1 hypothetical protein [Segnochrobactrum spirostomi]